MESRISRSKMTPHERSLRSRLNQLVGQAPFLRGTLSVREITCGKHNCRCARDEKHLTLYLSASQDGKPRQLFVPKSMEEEVRSWVKNFKRIRILQEEISRLYWDKLKKREH